ncbi:MAG: hypothetical protein D6B28_07195 [Gammaproteobacteria bacterium]|nr:MAG: hypothetical protein D6B28_07195 [Gammaproteobacteria bacterium]
MKLLKLFSIVVLAAALTACGGHPIKNIHRQDVISVNNKQVTKELVREAIIKAGVHRGWTMNEVEDGVIKGKLNIRKHFAEIEITYTEDLYSIKYVYSTGLQYDPTAKTIHRQYNNWITYLDRSIQVYLNRLQLGL